MASRVHTTLLRFCRMAMRGALAGGMALVIVACSDGGDDGGTGGGTVGDTTDSFSADIFADPPQEFGPLIRWWWPGGSIDATAVENHLRTLRDAGYAGVEVQPFVSAMSETDIASDPRIRTVGEPDFLAHLGSAACAAQSLGLQFDINLGSAWPTGNPAVTKSETERQLLLAELDLVGPLRFAGALPQPTEPSWLALARSVRECGTV